MWRTLPLLLVCGSISCTNYSSDPDARVVRALTRNLLSPGETTELQVLLENTGGIPLQKVHLAEHFPPGVRLVGVCVVVDGLDVTSWVVSETTSTGEVWPGCVTHRVVLDGAGAGGGGFPLSSRCQVTFTLSAEPGLYDLRRNHWVALVGGEEPVFGWGEEPLRLIATDETGRVPVALDVSTGLSETEPGATPEVIQTHLAALLGVSLPDALEVRFSSGEFIFDTGIEGRSAGMLSLSGSALARQGDAVRCVEGEVLLDLEAQKAGESLECGCVIRSAPEELVDLLREGGMLALDEELEGRSAGSARIVREPRGGRLVITADPRLSFLMALEAGVFTWTFPRGLFRLPEQGELRVTTRYRVEGVETSPVTETFPVGGVGAPLFRRGDANVDGTPDISDGIRILIHLFLEPGLDCLKAADSNDDGRLDITDSVFLLSYLFLGGQALPDPHPICGPDATPDDLPCGTYPLCE
jgi:hypothetical protein